jgi:formylglycine-generating enzyme required for sulfatase activity
LTVHRFQIIPTLIAKSCQLKKAFALIVCNSFCLLCISQIIPDSFHVYQQTIPGAAISSRMVPVPAGSFLLGSPMNEKGRLADEGPQKKVQIAAFWMSAFEVTRDEFDVFLKDESTSQNVDVDAITRPSPQYVDLSWGMGKEGGYPANSMSQYAALMYCRWLYQKTGIFYRLPTESEWEYACRAGTTTAYYFGNDSTQLDKYAWYSKNSNDKFQKVGQKLPNAWGLYDMLGNIMEWTLDHYQENRYSTITDNSMNPVMAPNASKYPKALRGGGYSETAGELRSAKRFRSDPDWNRRDPQIPKSKWWLTEARSVGFRIIRPLQAPTPSEAEQFFKQYIGK